MKNNKITTCDDNRSFEINIFTVKELAEVLKIGRDKAYALMHNRSFPSIKIGNRYIVTDQALSEWLIANVNKHVMV